MHGLAAGRGEGKRATYLTGVTDLLVMTLLATSYIFSELSMRYKPPTAYTYGNALVARKTYTATDAKKSYVDYTRLPVGTLKTFYLYVHAVESDAVVDARLQIWRVVDRDLARFRLVWEEPTKINLTQYAGKLYKVSNLESWLGLAGRPLEFPVLDGLNFLARNYLFHLLRESDI